MDADWQSKIFILGLLFVLSAFFSGSEVAFFSLNRNKIKNNLSSFPFTGVYILRLLEFPRRLLVTILIGNTLVNVAASIIAVSIALEFAATNNISEDSALTIQIVVLTIFVVLFGELTPKVWAAKNPLNFSKLVAFPLFWLSVILYPVAETLTELIRMSSTKLKLDKFKKVISSNDINDLAQLGHEKGTIVEEEHSLIQSIVNFQSVSVREVMTPRVDMTAISVDTSFEEVLKVVTSSGHSRIPLYKQNLDDIVGVLYAKDLLKYLPEPSKQATLSFSNIARKALFVPEAKMINDLMQEFLEKKMHIAIVVDEYGGTSGLISLEDVIEEIIGEIRDEYDKEE
ncbi:MAG: CNNM domain-containing protein, partial [Ignavibacteriaceae bacterium]|nr:CNNM domain-containing protein [Ignavibacteriaceae bacterium]